MVQGSRRRGASLGEWLHGVLKNAFIAHSTNGTMQLLQAPYCRGASFTQGAVTQSIIGSPEAKPRSASLRAAYSNPSPVQAHTWAWTSPNSPVTILGSRGQRRWDQSLDVAVLLGTVSFVIVSHKNTSHHVVWRIAISRLSSSQYRSSFLSQSFQRSRPSNKEPFNSCL